MKELPALTDLLLEQQRSVLHVTFNRPNAKNALSSTMIEGLNELCDWLDGSDIRTLVLRGADGVFCAGGDIKDFGKMIMAPEPAPGEKDFIATSNRIFGDLLLRMDALDQVLVCVVEGAAFGGANGFLAVADIVIAESGAKLSLSETTLGVVPAQIGPFLVRKIGLFQTRRLALTGSRFNPDQGAVLGLVDYVVNGQSSLENTLADLLEDIGKCEPAANAATKRVLNASAPEIHSHLLDKAADEFAVCLRGAGRVGAAAFAQKQTPPWVESYTDKK